VLHPRFDLGVRDLVPDWKALFSPKHFGADLGAGLTVACVAIPLSLAIALASGVPAATGLVTAIVAGVVCALFGGVPLQVSGPAAAMVVLVATIVQEHGLVALLLIGLGCGLLQVVTGILGLGRFVKLVPLPVIEGFTAGIGAIILIGQLPRALGLPPPPASHVFDVVTHVADLARDTSAAAVGVTLLTLAVIYTLPRVTKRVPPQLVAVVVATAVTAVFALDTPMIGAIPRALPTPSFPELTAELKLGAIAGSTLVVFALASLETLLSASAVDRQAPNQKRSDPDQELIGQGLGNIASALFGGIPVTGVIARSGMNIQAGAKTRRASIVHSLALVLSVFALAPLIERIPIAALAAVLFSVAFRMLSPAMFTHLWRHSRADGVVYAVTFVTIVFVDLLEGVQWGVVAALAIAAIRLGRARTAFRGVRLRDHHHFTIEGPLTFLSSLDIDGLRRELALIEPPRFVVFDARNITTMDASGVEILAGLFSDALARELAPVLLGVPGTYRVQVAAAIANGESAMVDDERALSARLGGVAATVDVRLRAGVERFRATTRPRYSDLFQQLAGGQAPHTLFITCSDSRINPNLITSTEPGELFIYRDVGNLVPPATDTHASPGGAAIDYAVGILGVQKIVVCGHSGCGAVKAILSDAPLPSRLQNLHAWLERTEARERLRSLPGSLHADEVAKLNALAQLDRLRAYPIVAEKLAVGELSLTAWFFDVKSGELEEWTPALQAYVPLGTLEERASSNGVSSRAGIAHETSEERASSNGVSSRAGIAHGHAQ
jgi:carbonic anhydrase